MSKTNYTVKTKGSKSVVTRDDKAGQFVSATFVYSRDAAERHPHTTSREIVPASSRSKKRSKK